MNNHKSTYFLYGPHLSIFMFMYFDSEWEWNLFFLLKFISKIMFHLHVREWHTCEHSREVGKGGGGVSYPPPPPPHFFFNGQPTTLSRLTWTESGQTQTAPLVTHPWSLLHTRGAYHHPCTPTVQLSPGSGGFFTSNTPLCLSGLPQVLQLDPLPLPQPNHPFCKSRFTRLCYILSNVNTEGLMN